MTYIYFAVPHWMPVEERAGVPLRVAARFGGYSDKVEFVSRNRKFRLYRMEEHASNNE